jgi:hypothetical protein
MRCCNAWKFENGHATWNVLKKQQNLIGDIPITFTSFLNLSFPPNDLNKITIMQPLGSYPYDFFC